MLYHLGYFFIPMLLFPFWAIIYISRKDLRKKLFKSGIIGMICGLLSEIWFKNDYWNPVSILTNYNTFIEDGLCGFLCVSVSCTLYDFLAFRKDIKSGRTKYGEAVMLFLVGLLLIILLSNCLKINSMISFCLIFFTTSLYIFYRRKELFVQSLISGLLFALVMLFIYSISYIIFIPDFWEKSLIESQLTQSRIFNSFPSIEIIWYFFWGLFVGPFFDYIGAHEKEKLETGKIFLSSFQMKTKHDHSGRDTIQDIGIL